jgi:hypothetical protein
MPQFRANWHAIPNRFNNGASSFKFQAASQADAAAIAAVVDGALDAQMTSLNLYVGSPAAVGTVHTEGTDRTGKFKFVSTAGVFIVHYLRNIRHGADAAAALAHQQSIIAAFVANSCDADGNAVLDASQPTRILPRGETEIEPEV